MRQWRPGDRVTLPFCLGCGRCSQCQAGQQQICDHYYQPGFTGWGSFAEFVKQHELQAKPEQVRALVEDAAQSYEHPEEVVRWYYAQQERLGEFESAAIEANVVAWMLAGVKVVDKPVAFAELMGQAS